MDLVLCVGEGCIISSRCAVLASTLTPIKGIVWRWESGGGLSSVFSFSVCCAPLVSQRLCAVGVVIGKGSSKFGKGKVPVSQREEPVAWCSKITLLFLGQE